MDVFDSCGFSRLIEAIGREAVRLWGEHAAVDVTYRIQLVDGKISGETAIRISRVGVRCWEHIYTEATADLAPFEQIRQLFVAAKNGTELQV